MGDGIFQGKLFFTCDKGYALFVPGESVHATKKQHTAFTTKHARAQSILDILSPSSQSSLAKTLTSSTSIASRLLDGTRVESHHKQAARVLQRFYRRYWTPLAKENLDEFSSEFGFEDTHEEQSTVDWKWWMKAWNGVRKPSITSASRKSSIANGSDLQSSSKDVDDVKNMMRKRSSIGLRRSLDMSSSSKRRLKASRRTSLANLKTIELEWDGPAQLSSVNTITKEIVLDLVKFSADEDASSLGKSRRICRKRICFDTNDGDSSSL